MLIKSLTLFILLAASSLFAQTDPVIIGVPVPIPTPDPNGDVCDAYGSQDSPACMQPPSQNLCYDYNRDGVSCEEVGMHEGQVAAPWGDESGLFRCVDGCLAWVEQTPYCKDYNRDGVTCEQVDYHEGQIGYPWGWHSGKFRCQDGCLKFMWWW
ncbi:MAG: hypothetical protein ACOH5I_23120 [Oligoflexus sp.]